MSAWEILPLQWGKILFFFLLSLGLIVGLEYLYWTRLDWAIHLGVESLPIFDFGTPGNLSAWFSSGLWFVCAALCMIAFLIGRRQGQASQLSDIWLWATFGSLLLSADAVCQVKDFIRIVLFKFSGTNLYANGEIWWIAVYVFVFGTIGSRLLIEMRHYLPACNAFFVAALSSLLACCIPLNIVELPFEDARMPIILRCGLEMTGALFAVLAFSLFVRKMLLACQQGEKVAKPVAKEQKLETVPQPPKSSEAKPTAAPVLPSKSVDEKPKTSPALNFKLDSKPAPPKDEKPVETKSVPEKPADSPDEETPVFFSVEEDDEKEKDVKNKDDESSSKKKEEEKEDKRPVRTCQIVHPLANGEKIVKVEPIDDILDEEEIEKKSAKKINSSQKRVPTKADDDEIFEDEEDDDFDLDEAEQEQLEELLLKLKRKRSQKRKAG